MGAAAILEAIELASNALVAVMNVFGSTQTVSDIIKQQIDSGATSWTDEQRAMVTKELDAARDELDRKLAAKGV